MDGADPNPKPKAEDEAQSIATLIVTELDPENADVITDDWDVLKRAQFRPAPPDSEHRFAAAAFTALGVALGCMIGKIFAEAAKDIVKEEAVRLWRKWRTSPISLTDHETSQLIKAMDREAVSLGLSGQLRTEIRGRLEEFLKGGES